MIPASFTESNNFVRAPEGMEEDCEPLSVMQGQVNNYPVVMSCWKLTQEELNEINKTGRVWLLVMGETMPPVKLLGIKPEVT